MYKIIKCFHYRLLSYNLLIQNVYFCNSEKETPLLYNKLVIVNWFNYSKINYNLLRSIFPVLLRGLPGKNSNITPITGYDCVKNLV